MGDYVSQDPGLVVLPPGLSSSALTNLEIRPFKRQSEEDEGEVRFLPHGNGKIVASDPASFCFFSVILLFDAHTHSHRRTHTYTLHLLGGMTVLVR